MKHILTTIAAVLVVGCGESQQSATTPETKPEPPTAKAPDISIHDAVLDGDIEAVKQHIAAGTDVNAIDDDWGAPPLHLAADQGYKEIVELLIAKGADVNAKNKFGSTPMHKAARRGQKEVNELLIDNGADVNAKNNRGRTALDLASGKTANLLRKHGGKTKKELEATGK